MSELKKTDHITRESILRSRLENGERGIPKIPGSPDTRHAQAQPPRPEHLFTELLTCQGEPECRSSASTVEICASLRAATMKEAARMICPDCALWGDPETTARGFLHSRDGIWYRCLAASLWAEVHRRPAEQPAPPRHVCGLAGYGAVGDSCPACVAGRFTATAQPSAPPQPARRKMLMRGISDPTPHDEVPGCSLFCSPMTTAEPSVEVRQLMDWATRIVRIIHDQEWLTKIVIVEDALAAAKREGLEEAARLVCGGCALNVAVLPKWHNTEHPWHQGTDGTTFLCTAHAIWTALSKEQQQ